MVKFPLAPSSAARHLLLARMRMLGGKGSGNFGHAGRPGEVGGSLLSEPKATDFSRPAVGIISSSGEVKTRNSNAQFNSHEQMFGERRPAHHRFRVEGSEVQWDEEPSADEAFRVEDHVAEHGAQVTAHAVLAGYLGGKRYFSPGELPPIKNPRHLASKLPLHAAADVQVPKLEVLVRYAFAMGRKALPDADAAIKATEKALKRLLPAALEKIVAAGIEATPEMPAAEEALRTAKPKLPTRKQAASDWADEHAADLIKGISKTTRERVNAAVSEYSARPLQLLGALKKALGDEERARTIARTESMRAAHKGQQIVWQEAQDEGLLSEKAKRVWIVTDDDKLCPICEPLDGKTAALDDAYDAGSEYIDGPPAHPNCRCSEGLA